MMAVNRLLTNMLTTNLAASKAFYTTLFGFQIAFDSDWFVQLVVEGTGLELGLIVKGHEVMPEGVVGTNGGVYLTLVVDDVNQVYDKARELNLDIRQEPQLTPYGQRRMLLRSPEGGIVDVSSPDNG